jgi:hypothetical protein
MRLLLLISCATILLSSCLQTSKTAKPAENTVGELTDGQVHFMDTINGKTSFILFDGVQVETAPAHNNWLQIELFVALTPDQYDALKIYPNEKLYALDGHETGMATDTISILFADEQAGLISGYTRIENLKQHTIPEIALSAEIKKGNRTFKSLEPYLNAFEFVDAGFTAEDESTYQQYMIYESTILDPSPRDRITLIFNNKGLLIGAVHSRKPDMPDYQTHELIRGHSFTVLGKLTKAEIDKIKQQKIAFYHSID